jgi:hypothetical protein
MMRACARARKLLLIAATVLGCTGLMATNAYADSRPSIGYIEFHGSWIAVHGTNIWPGTIQIRAADGSGRLVGDCGSDNSQSGALCGVQQDNAFGQILAVPMDPHAPAGRYAVTATNHAIGNNVSPPFFFTLGVPSVVNPPRVLRLHPAVGLIARASPGTWLVGNGSAYHADAVWESCGAVCRDVATGWSYRPTWSDLGNRLRVRVTMTDDHGTGGPAESAFTFPVTPPPPPPPVNTALPTLAPANPHIGVVESVNPGAWSNSPNEFHYQWFSCAQLCRSVGSDAPTYTPRLADKGRRLHVRVTATNAGGSASARTAASPKVS